MTKSRNKKNAIEPPHLLVAVVRHLFMKRFGVMLLVTTTLASAFFLVLLTHEKRQLFAELEQLNKERDQLDDEWRQLRVEQRHLADPFRLQVEAEEHLDMKILDLKSERIIKRVKDSD